MPNAAPVVVPHNLEAEQAVLGALFIDPRVADDVRAILPQPEMFYRASHQHIYRAMLDLAGRGRELDWIHVADEVRKQRAVEACGGEEMLNAYLAEISAAVPSSYGAEGYAAMVRDRYILRELVHETGDIRAQALESAHSSHEIVERLVKLAMRLSLVPTSKDPRHVADIGAQVREQAKTGGIVGLETGWAALDAICRGFKPGELVIVGARPGQGKSSFAAALALKHRADGVLVFSPEMSGEEIYPRLIAMHAGIDANAYAQGRLNEHDHARAVQAEAEIDASALWFDDAGKISVSELRTQARRWAARNKLKLLIVDYIGLVEPTDKRVARYEQVGEVTRALKQLARELQVPVIAPHQLGRQAETHEPTLADLRESGNCEQDADQVLFIHKTGATAGGCTPVKIIVAKHRNGPTGTVNMMFRRACTRFEIMAANAQPHWQEGDA